MKLKCRPDHFVVTEKLNVRPTGGPGVLYHLNKTNIGTLEAIQQISRVWNLPLNRIAHAGLKDRHSVNTTIDNDPKRTAHRSAKGPLSCRVSGTNGFGADGCESPE
jgi:tRNA pseudouridine13 synthase